MRLTELQQFKNLSDHSWLPRLFALNIRHVEQVGSLLAAPEGRYGLEMLGVPVDTLQSAVEPELRNRFGLSLSDPEKTGSATNASLLTSKRYLMGFVAGHRDPFRGVSFGGALPDPLRPRGRAQQTPESTSPEVTLGPDDPFTAGDQGRRGTCVAFAVAGMYQVTRHGNHLNPVLLSQQYLYYRARDEDEFDPDEEGTSIEAALRVLKEHGCCPESFVRYRPRHDLRQIYTVRGHKPLKPETKLREMAKAHRISDYRLIGHSVEAVKAELDAGRAVGVGLAVYQLAWYNSLARSRGEIAMPLMDTAEPQTKILDQYLGGHAVVLAGYRDNSVEPSEESHRPGGGYFLFRNSWGEEWAKGNTYARGYGYLPYEYVERFCLEAAVIDKLARAPAKRNGAKELTGSPTKPHKPDNPRWKPPRKPGAARKG